jgi:uncharacterized protein (TIGR02271 family)
MQRTAVGVFDNRERAQQAVAELKRLGFTENEIGVAAQGDERQSVHKEEEGNHAGAGAAAGVAGGLGVGALWGLGIIAGVLPAVGPVIAGGVLASIAASAAAGAAAGGLAGALIGMGIPDDEAEYYETEFRRGRTIVTVQAGDRYDEARAVLRREGGYDISSRTADTGTTAATAERNTHLELREERLKAAKEVARSGEVNLRKEVVTEKQAVDIPIEREEVVIERHPASGARRATGPVGESEEITIPVKEERGRVTKETVATGEVDVKKRTVRDVEHVEDTVKKERLRVDGEGVQEVSRSGNVREKSNRS